MNPATWYGVVKVQRELVPERDRHVMINDRNGSIVTILPMTPALLEMFGDDLKFYARAELRDTIINIKRRVADRNW